ncbi:MAG: FixH family protein [Firmicutes bacterium]|jgi:hypothetical protein|nr:FixH family protein [Bacillota bacterium]
MRDKLTSAARLLISLFAVSLLFASCAKKTLPLPKPGRFIEKNRHGAIVMDITPWPPKTGTAEVQIRIFSRHNNPVSNASVKMDFSMPSMGMPGQKLNLTSSGNGTYQGNVKFTFATKWQVSVSVKIPHHRSLSGVFSFRVPY